MATETREPDTTLPRLSPAQQILFKLNDLFEPAESLRWLASPLRDFDATPMQLIERGRADIVLHILIRLEEGIHI